MVLKDFKVFLQRANIRLPNNKVREYYQVGWHQIVLLVKFSACILAEGVCRYCKSSIKPPGGLFNLQGSRGGLLRRGFMERELI